LCFDEFSGYYDFEKNPLFKLVFWWIIWYM
jgi:hypothetical protein